MASFYKVGVLTISDRCSQGQAEDKSGPKLVEIVTKELGWVVTQQSIVPDDIDEIKNVLCNWSDIQKLALVLTTGQNLVLIFRNPILISKCCVKFRKIHKTYLQEVPDFLREMSLQKPQKIFWKEKHQDWYMQ